MRNSPHPPHEPSPITPTVIPGDGVIYGHDGTHAPQYALAILRNCSLVVIVVVYEKFLFEFKKKISAPRFLLADYKTPK